SALERTSPLRVILGLGAAPIRDQVMRRFEGAHVAECFGSTDAGVVTITPLGAAWRPESCGPPVPGVALRILDDDGRPLPPRRAGEIAVRSPARLSAYFRDPEATVAALRDGWFLTGDLGFVDEDGWLSFVGRKRSARGRSGGVGTRRSRAWGGPSRIRPRDGSRAPCVAAGGGDRPRHQRPRPPSLPARRSGTVAGGEPCRRRRDRCRRDRLHQRRRPRRDGARPRPHLPPPQGRPRARRRGAVERSWR